MWVRQSEQGPWLTHDIGLAFIWTKYTQTGIVYRRIARCYPLRSGRCLSGDCAGDASSALLFPGKDAKQIHCLLKGVSGRAAGVISRGERALYSGFGDVESR
ncbi:hypothetical protein CSUI_004052 [Cystoisospora suis]|uniref:Uncharacterized protein n=1 Tax=Cystoisospora suis TaxID=483139 RepID=A0A2C6L2J0_9APIC|nr:hypothetical protein CSUI_004052 [Cystoisospora suis]